MLCCICRVFYIYLKVKIIHSVPTTITCSARVEVHVRISMDSLCFAGVIQLSTAAQHTVDDEHLTRTSRPTCMHDDLNKAFPSKPNFRSSAEVMTSNISNCDLQQNVSGAEVGKRPRPSSFFQSADVMSNKPPNWDLQQNATLTEVNNQPKPRTLFRPAEVMSSNTPNGDQQQKVTGQVINNQPEQSSLFRHGRASTATYFWQMETVYYLTASLLNLLTIHSTHPNSMVEDSIREQHLRIMQLTESSLRPLPPQRR